MRSATLLPHNLMRPQPSRQFTPTGVQQSMAQPPRGFWVKRSTIHATGHLLAAISVLLLSIACFVFSTSFGLIATFLMTLILGVMLPAATPVLLITAFLFQNMGIAFFIPAMGDSQGFDAVRGVNFVILLTAMGVFFGAAFLHAERLPQKTKNWILIVLAVVGLVVLYLGLGAVRGDPKDALIYFRNTLTPLACLGIGLIAASLYKVYLRQTLTILGVAAIAYGYAELFFTIDFLAVFNGDEYFRLRLSNQIESGYWDKILENTGYVLLGLDDVMKVPFLNMAFFDQWFPHVFRLSGPNIHPISYAYALSVISAWMLYSKRTWFVILAFPLLLIIGSKGALVLLLSAICLKIGVKFLGLRFTVLSMILVLTAYITAAIIYGRSIGDYHVLGFLAGIRDFLRNPFGQGLGFGGNLSSTIKNVLSWTRAQHQGIADIPVESALGVMLYQMGIAAMAYFALMLATAKTCYSEFQKTGKPEFLFGIAAIVTLFTNAVLQEEAIYSPLALGLTLLLIGVALGEQWRTDSQHTHTARRVIQ